LAHEHINSDLSRLWLLMTLASMREVGAARRANPWTQGGDGHETIRRRGGKAPAVAISGNLLPCSSTNFVLAQRAFRRTNRVNKKTTSRLVRYRILYLFPVYSYRPVFFSTFTIAYSHSAWAMRPQGLEPAIGRARAQHLP
jgi:hypothetical protein